MDPQQISAELKAQRELIEKIFRSVEKTRKMILWTAIISLVVIVLPMIGLIFVIPSFIDNYNSTLTTALQGLK